MLLMVLLLMSMQQPLKAKPNALAKMSCCPEGPLNVENGQCLKSDQACPKTLLFRLSMCIDECPGNMPFISNEKDSYKNTKICIAQCPPGKHQLVKSDETVCVSDCPSDMRLIPDKNKCSDSDDIDCGHKLHDETRDKCVSECPGDTYRVVGKAKCVDNNGCPSDYWLLPGQNKCVSECPTQKNTERPPYKPLKDVSGDQNKCVEMCTGGAYLVEDKNKCVKASNCPEGMFPDAVTNKCVKHCPDGHPLETTVQPHQCTYADNCVNTANPLLDRTRNKCVSECQKGHPFLPNVDPQENQNQCVSSCPEDTKLIQNRCVGKCKPGHPFSKRKGKCHSACWLNDQYYHPKTNNCVSECPSGKIDGRCQVCQAGKHWSYYQTKCVEKCHNNLEPTDKNVCACPDAKPFYDEDTGKCIRKKACIFKPGFVLDVADDRPQKCFSSSCPGKMRKDEEDRHCIPFGDVSSEWFYSSQKNQFVKQCPDQAPYGDKASKTCVKECQEGHPLDPDKNICLKNNKACDKALAKSANKCISKDKCKGPYDSASQMCVKQCPDSHPLAPDRNECVQKCDVLTPAKILLPRSTKSNKCITKPEDGGCQGVTNEKIDYPYYDVVDEECVSECPEGAPLIAGKNRCVESCPDGLFEVVGKNKCVKPSNCPSDQPFHNTETQKCVSSCPVGDPLLHGTKRCLNNCSDVEGTFLIEAKNECVKKCPSDTKAKADSNNPVCEPQCGNAEVYDIPGTRCVTDCPSGTYLYDPYDQCVSNCPGKTILKGDECVLACKDSLYNKADHECVSHCPWYTYKFRNQCLPIAVCPKDKPWYDEHANECVSHCPIGHPLYRPGLKCVKNECPEGTKLKPGKNECVW